MCVRCDGYSDDDVERMTDLHIRVYGYSLVQVETDHPWCYTIGLHESYGHPELVAAGLTMEAEVELIRTVAGWVAADQVTPERLRRHGFGLVTVHRSHFADGMFGSWEGFYDQPAPPGMFMQVVPPACWFCPTHQHTITRLDRPPATRRTR